MMVEKNKQSRYPKLPVQARSREKVDRIFDASTRLLASESADKISIRAIAREADVSLGTIYQFFADKQAIFNALGDSFEAAIIERCEKELTAELARSDIGDFVSRLISAVLEVQENHAGFVCIVRGSEHEHFADVVLRVRLRIRDLLNRHFKAAYPGIKPSARELALSIFGASLMSVLAGLPKEKGRKRNQYLRASHEMLVPFLTKQFVQ